MNKLILAASLGLLTCGGLRAQEAAPAAAAPAARCTGVLCELYYANRPAGQPDPTALPCHDFVCGMFGGRTADHPAQQASAVPEPIAAPAQAPSKAKHKARHAAKSGAGRSTKVAATKGDAVKAEPTEAKAGEAAAH